MELLRRLRSLIPLPARNRGAGCKGVVVALVYISLVLDNILLTVVVPIIPDFLYQVEHNSGGTATTENPLNRTTLPPGKASISNVRVRYPGGPAFLLPQNQTLIVLDFPNTKATSQQPATAETTSPIPDSVLPKVPVPVVLKDILESSVVGIGSGTDYIPEMLIHENGRVGALFASKAFVQLAINPLVGTVTARFGYSAPLMCGTATLLLSALMFSAVSTFPWLMVARSLQGVASACIAVAGMGMIAHLYDDEKERSKVMGTVLGGIAAGVLIGYPFGGILYDFSGKTAPFVIITILTVAVLAAQILFIPNISNTDEEEDESSSLVRGAESFMRFGCDWEILIVTGAVWVSTTAMAMLEPCLPIWLMSTIHPEKWQLGTVFLPDSLGYLLGTNFFAVPALKFGRHRLAMGSLLLVGGSCITVTFARNMWHLALPHFGLGLGIGVVDSALMPLLAFLVDERKSGAYGAVYAIAQTAVSLAYGLGPLIGGYLVEIVGFPNIMRAVGVMNILYVPFLVLLKRSSNRSSAKEGELDSDGDGGEGLRQVDRALGQSTTGYGATSAQDIGLSTYQQFENPIH